MNEREQAESVSDLAQELENTRELYLNSLPDNVKREFYSEAYYDGGTLARIAQCEKFIGDKTWILRINNTHIYLTSEDAFGKSKSISLTGKDSLLVWYGAESTPLDYFSRVMDFCRESLESSFREKLERTYDKVLSQLSPELQEMSRKLLNLMRAAKFTEDRLREDTEKLEKRSATLEESVDNWQSLHSEEMQGRIQAEELLRECREQRRAFLNEAVANHDETKGKLQRLQRVIEREAMNLLNTKSFLGVKSKTLQGIRERLMAAISKESLGEDSIYFDAPPPTGLMPPSMPSITKGSSWGGGRRPKGAESAVEPGMDETPGPRPEDPFNKVQPVGGDSKKRSYWDGDVWVNPPPDYPPPDCPPDEEYDWPGRGNFDVHPEPDYPPPDPKDVPSELDEDEM